MSSAIELIQASPAMMAPTFTTLEPAVQTQRKPPMVPRRRYFTFNCSSADAVDNLVLAAISADIVKGCAHICFSQDGAWFEGQLTTADNSGQYALHGHRQRGWTPPPTADDVTSNGHSDAIPIITNGHRQEEASASSGEDSPPMSMVAPPSGTPEGAETPPSDAEVSGLYDVTVVDHDDEQAYPFRAVRLMTRSDSLWSLSSPNLSFAAQKTHRGQKADMLIQKHLTPRLVGNGLKVSVGLLTMNLAADDGGENGPMPRRTSSDSRLWCL